MDSSFFLTIVAAAIGLLTLLRSFGLSTLLRKLIFHQEDNRENDSSSSSCIWTHDVFPSFHGEDVRRNFLSHVQLEFERKGITSFIDNKMKRGESIRPELVRAIRGSKIAIILLSRNYASSTWCLDELVEIMKCRKELGQTVLAVFYEVDPSDVKKLTGDFGKVFRQTCSGKTNDCIKRWRQAFAKVGTIAGYDSRNWDNDAAMIKEITTDISNMLNKFTPSNDFDLLIGMGAHLERMEPLLCLDSDEVRMIGIWGPPGIGKTTIARFAFSRFSDNFQLSVFMEDLKANYSRLCSDDYSLKLQLQQQFMSQITDHKDMVVSHLGVASNRLKHKKVLVVLDGVDRSLQLDALAKETLWFGPGSRIIITTQDHKLFRAHGINHIYEVDFPTNKEALQIFCTSCFGQKFPKDGFEELAREVTRLAGELPLGLRVMGSYFRGMSKQEWTNSLPRLRTSLNHDIRSILKLSYDALDDEDKDLFLHIACFFNSEYIHKVEEHLAKKFIGVRQRLKDLAEKSLISIDSGVIRMHSLLEKLGREIVCKQSIHEPGQRQFLYDEREIRQVLTGDSTGSTSVIGIKLKYYSEEEEIDISEKAFEGMSNLQFLRVYRSRDTLQITGGLNYLSHKLRLLEWRYFPMPCFPCIVNLEFLVELIMDHSKLEKLWEGIKSLGSLKWMDLRYSVNLKEFPDLSTATKLEKLNLSYCSSLTKLPSLPGYSLEELELGGCSSLLEPPSLNGNAVNLRKLDLRDFQNLVELPSYLENATNLEHLNLCNCSSLIKLHSLPRDNLEELDMKGCSSLVELPSIVGNAVNLRELYLRHCSSLIKLPSLPGNSLEVLDLGGCSSLVEFPSFVGDAVNLQKLDLSDCSNLVELPLSFGNIQKLQKLILKGCSKLENFPNNITMEFLKDLDLDGCSSLDLSTIGNAVNLRSLDLSSLPQLSEVPSFIGNATNLENLVISSCSNLVELPLLIGNLQKLRWLSLAGCGKLEVLPTNINLESLDVLNLNDCSMLKCFPEISTNIRILDLVGTAIEQVPPSIRSWPRLYELKMSYFENLTEFPHALETITSLWLTDKEIREVPPLVEKISRLGQLVVNGCRKLVSLPPISEFVDSIDASDCELLEMIECSFPNPMFDLNFANCFKLNQEARDLIIQTNSRYAVLPGRQVPEYFTHRASGGGPLTIKLNEKPLPESMRFKACIMLLNKGDHDACSKEESTEAVVKYKYHSQRLYPALAEHLYTFRVKAGVTSSELLFEFKLESDDVWKIGECGIVQDLKVPWYW